MDWTEDYLHRTGMLLQPATADEAGRALRCLEGFLATGGRLDPEAFAIWRLSGNGGRKVPAKTTVNKQLRHLSAAWKWAVDQGLATDNPFKNFQLKTTRKVPRVVDICAVKALMDLAWQEPRLAALPTLCFYLALRVGEAVGQLSEDVSPYGATVTVRAHEHCRLKGHQEMSMEVPQEARHILAMSRKLGRFVVGGEDEPLTRERVYYAFDRWSKKLGVRILPHDLRRTALTKAADDGAPPSHLQAFARHGSSDTTMRYYVRGQAGNVPKMLQIRGDAPPQSHTQGT